MNGWRGRIGLIIPSANSNMEPEFYKMAPEEVSTHTSRMMLPKLTVENLIEMGKLAVDSALELKTAAVDILVFGCTSGSFVKGLGHDREIIEELEGATSIPAITTSTAVLEAFRLLGVKTISVASPYGDDINQRLETFLKESGFEVLAVKGLGLGDRKIVFPLSGQAISTIGIQEPYIAYKLVKQLASTEADAYFVPCTNFRTVEVISRLEDDLQKPVITSNQASLSMALRRLGIRNAVKGFGRLFDL